MGELRSGRERKGVGNTECIRGVSGTGSGKEMGELMGFEVYEL
jgi:hypothetical protein